MTDTKLHYCMVVHAHYPIGEPRVEREAEALNRNGYAVDVYCLKHAHEPAFETIDGINIYRLSVQRHKKSGVIVQFFEYLTFFILVFFRLIRPPVRYNVVQVHNLPDFLVFSAFFPRMRGARIILDIHDLMPEFFLSRFKQKNRWLVWLLKLQEKLACSFADHVITVTEPWRQTLIERSTSADKCSVVMNVAGMRFNQGAEKIEKKQKQNGKFYLFYHGTLAYRYGIDLALHAVAQVRKDLPKLRFIIHGRGEYLDQLRHLSDELELNDVVIFSNEYVPTEELPGIIASAHAGIVPYRRDIFTDGILPTKLMEYTALGIPAVVARTPGISAYFDDAMVEFFTPEDVEDMAHHIRVLYHDQSRLQTLAANTEKFNEQYNWSVQSIEYLNLVKKLACT